MSFSLPAPKGGNFVPKVDEIKSLLFWDSSFKNARILGKYFIRSSGIFVLFIFSSEI